MLKQNKTKLKKKQQNKTLKWAKQQKLKKIWQIFCSCRFLIHPITNVCFFIIVVVVTAFALMLVQLVFLMLLFLLGYLANVCMHVCM